MFSSIGADVFRFLEPATEDTIKRDPTNDVWIPKTVERKASCILCLYVVRMHNEPFFSKSCLYTVVFYYAFVICEQSMTE